MKPLAIDLYCGLGGWTDGLLAEGYDVIGFDIEKHEYGDAKYPATLVLQNVLTLHGSQFKDAALIVGSSPCQEFSYRAMPWKRAKALPPPHLGMELFHAQFRIQREACEAAGRYIPLVVENVRGAQPWVGRSRWNFGSFHLWGDVPALMPMAKAMAKVPGLNWSGYGQPGYKAQGFNTTADQIVAGRKNGGGSWFAVANNTTSGHSQNPRDGIANAEREREREREHQRRGRIVVRPEQGRPRTQDEQQEQGAQSSVSADRQDSDCAVSAHSESLSAMMDRGVKGFTPNGERLGKNTLGRKHGSKSKARKAASAQIAKIPLPLSRYIARVYRP